MRFLLVCTLLVLLASNVELSNRKRKTGSTKRVNTASAFEDAGIPADTNVTAPERLLQVTFGENTKVNLGNEIYPGKTINLTCIEYKNGTPDCFYTLVILDIDFPSAADPYLSPSLRGLWVNIVNSDLQSADIVADYVPATPPPGTGVHRVVFYFYRQNGVINAKAFGYLQFVLAVFDLEGFVKKNNLCLEAGNFYVTQFPDDLEEACDDSCSR